MIKNYTHNVIRLRKGKPSVCQVYGVIVILNKKKTSSQKQVEQLGFFMHGEEKVFCLNYSRLAFYLNKGFKLKKSIKKFIYGNSDFDDLEKVDFEETDFEESEGTPSEESDSIESDNDNSFNDLYSDLIESDETVSNECDLADFEDEVPSDSEESEESEDNTYKRKQRELNLIKHLNLKI